MSAVGYFLVALIAAVLVGWVRGATHPAPAFQPAMRPRKARTIRIEARPEPALSEAVLVESRA